MRFFKLLSFSLVISFLLLSGLNAEPIGTTGKIKGKVTDEKGASLPGATIKVEGTNLGTSSDDAGEYVIINVPVGTYSVKCSYLGYKTEVQTEVRVSADITTTVDFTLTEVGIIKTDTLEIIAKRNTLNPDQSGRIITEEFIQTTGIRGIENLAAKTAGVVQDERGGAINIRGGRPNETAIIIDGVLTTNPLDGSSTAYVSNNLLQEMAVLTGGFSAEYGNVLSGIINVTTKSGTSNYSGSAEVISDNIFTRILNTNTQGYNLYNVNIGGPIIPTKKLKNFITFYGGVERNFNLVTNPSWITDKLDLPGNLLPGYDLKRWSGNGKLTFDFSNLNKKLMLRLTGGANISRTIARGFVQAYMLENWQRAPQYLTDNDQFYGKVTHQFSNKLFYEVQFSYFSTKSVTQDPQLAAIAKENGFSTSDLIFMYGDPKYVDGIKFLGDRIQFDQYGLFAKYNRVFNRYAKSRTQYLEGSFNVTSQIKKNEIKLGGNYKYHTIRSYEVGPVGLAPHKGKPDVRNFFVGTTGLANFWGYSFDGNELNDAKPTPGDPLSFDGAKHPITAALYLQDKIEFKDFTINAGLRFDYLDANTWRIKDIANIVKFGNPTALDLEDFDIKSKPTYALSPRLGFSFPVTVNTIFHAQYGKFIQLPMLDYLYNGYENLTFWVNNAGYSGSFGNPNLEPEKTTSFEIGVKQQFGDRLSTDITVFYKETKDLIGIKQYPQLPNQIQVYENQDYGTIRGMDVSIDLRRTKGLAMSIAYSLSFASGTGSNPNSAGIAAWLGGEMPKFSYPLDYDQRHTGSINFDYRFGKTDLPKGAWGAILSRLGANLLYSFNSGRPYTKKNPSTNPFSGTGSGATTQSGLNQAYGPWNHRLDLKIDKTVTIWRLDFNFYAYIINVLNYELVNDVWNSSGLPGTTGFLETQQGRDLAKSYDGSSLTSSEEFIYKYGLLSKAIGNYGPPRQIRFGVKLNF